MSRQLNALLMLLVSGLFTGVLWTLAIERIWIWRVMDVGEFATDFRRSVRRVDLVQPVGAVLTLALAIGYATTVGGSARTLTIIAAVLVLIVIVLSTAIGVPMQKLFRSAEAGEPAPAAVDVATVRERWVKLHLVRTAIGLAAFALLVVVALYP